MKKQTISDRPAKVKCKEYLQTLGYTDIRAGKRGEGCDLVAEFNKELFYIEIKYSSLKKGQFFGTVMLTDLEKSVSLEKNFLFLICRGEAEAKIEEWFFKIFTPRLFWEHCSLTTPIFHYRLHLDGLGNIEKNINYSPDTIKANPSLILDMWASFCGWKNIF